MACGNKVLDDGTSRAREPRVAVFIDGSNLHHRLVDCGWPTNLDIAGFARKLAGHRTVSGIYYYNVPPPHTHGRESIAAQGRYYERIRASQGVTFRLGHLQERKTRH